MSESESVLSAFEKNQVEAFCSHLLIYCNIYLCFLQGNLKPDVFGFISRESGSQLICHLLKCCTNDLVITLCYLLTHSPLLTRITNIRNLIVVLC